MNTHSSRILTSITLALTLTVLTLTHSNHARAADAVVSKPAPAFSVTDASGKVRTLGEFAGKTVVLEWLNHGCPFVRKHYDSGNMQSLQKEFTGKGIVWLSVISSAKGKQGYSEPKQALDDVKTNKAAPTAVLLDTDGKMGKAYGARVTPHLFIIDAKGTLVYAGGIDDKATSEMEDIATSKNYVRAALDEILAGKAVTQATSKPYGCGVKYTN